MIGDGKEDVLARAETALADLTTFLELVNKMRTAQKKYFKTRDKGDLLESKALERRVDEALKRETK